VPDDVHVEIPFLATKIYKLGKGMELYIEMPADLDQSGR